MDTNQALRALLLEYRQVEGEIAAMEEERQALRGRVQELMQAAGMERSAVDLGAETAYLSLETRTEVVYDEDLLRERLGDKYADILEPDPRKLRDGPPEIREALAPFLDRIGSPSRQRIRAAIQSGAIEQSAFEGAFDKTRKTVLYVKKNLPLRSGGTRS